MFLVVSGEKKEKKRGRKEMGSKGNENMFGNKGRRKKKREKYTNLSSVWFAQEREVERKVYIFYFLCPHEFKGDKNS